MNINHITMSFEQDKQTILELYKQATLGSYLEFLDASLERNRKNRDVLHHSHLNELNELKVWHKKESEMLDDWSNFIVGCYQQLIDMIKITVNK